MDAVQIREMASTDATAVSVLGAQLGYESTAEETSRRIANVRARPGNAVFVAVEGGVIVGWAHVCAVARIATDGYAEIGGIVVSSSHRRRGIGERLVRACEQWGAAAGHSKLRLRSGVHRGEAHEFYRQLGYIQSKASYAFERPIGVENVENAV
jgi:GNAT superfamily N-acetyltransferase